MQIRGLCFSYGDTTIFKDFDLDIMDGAVNVVMGASGIGKTTLLNIVAGLLPYDGEIDGKPSRVSYIFQNDRLINTISVYKNLDLILRVDIKDKKERRRRIEQMLDLLEILPLKNKLPTSISGGERQRVAMARAYLYNSDVLLMDEPFKALDVALKTRLIAALLKLNEHEPRTVIYVTHSVDEALLSADRLTVLSGRPAEAIYSTKIDISNRERKLSDPRFQDIRSDLLQAIEGESGEI